MSELMSDISGSVDLDSETKEFRAFWKAMMEEYGQAGIPKYFFARKAWHAAQSSRAPTPAPAGLREAAQEMLDCLDQLEKEEAEQGGVHDAGCIVCIAAEKLRAALATPAAPTEGKAGNPERSTT